jgi:beta-fructofuranosidase
MLFHKPRDGFLGDVTPFYWNGEYHAFYLKTPPHRRRHIATVPPDAHLVGDEFWREVFRPCHLNLQYSYAHAVSEDLYNWEEWPMAIEPGGPREPDRMGTWTGSIIEREGVFHFFYTGFAGPEYPQTTCHATSSDLVVWRKDPRNPILDADPRWYDATDWRDPFPFWNEETKSYWMLISARLREGPTNRRGCIALAVSPDLEHWEIRPPLWSPHLYYALECPDLFRCGDRWVLVFSEFSDRWSTRFRVADSLHGPWLAPAIDTIDGYHYYAAKTASDGKRRFAFGWSPTRQGETDKGSWEYGGSLVVHQFKCEEDGSIAVGAPPELEKRFPSRKALSFRPRFGQWENERGVLKAKQNSGFAACTLGDLPSTCYLSCDITCDPTTHSCGLFLFADHELESYYQLRWECNRYRVVFDRFPRLGYDPLMIERPLGADKGQQLSLKIFIDGTVLVAYLNDAVALTTRIYDHLSGQLGLFVKDGEATFSNVKVYTQHNNGKTS